MSSRFVLTALMLPVFLAGCGGDPEPRIAAPVSSTPPTSASPTESTAPDGETIESFVQRWAEASSAMQNSGDSSRYRALSVGCAPCSDLADRVDTYYRDGGYISFDGFEVHRLRNERSAAGRRIVDVPVTVGATTYRTSKTATEMTLPGGRSQYRMTLSKPSGVWNLDDIVEVAG